MVQLQKKRNQTYANIGEIGSTVYAYESAQQDGTSTQGVNNIPSVEDIKRQEEEERKRQELERIHAEARRQVNVAAATGLAAGATSGSRRAATAGAIIGFLGGVAANCQNCHK